MLKTINYFKFMGIYGSDSFIGMKYSDPIYVVNKRGSKKNIHAKTKVNTKSKVMKRNRMK